MAAMPEELDAFLGAMPNKQDTVLAGRQFWCGHWHGHDVVAVLCGIGKVAASTTATLLCSHFGASQVIFTGVAGGLNPSAAGPVRVGDVVVATELLQHDLDASPLFPRHDIPGLGISRLRTCPQLSSVLVQAAQHALLNDPASQVHQGLIISGDRFVSSAAEAHALCTELPDALAVEMEGAAMAQVCHAFGVPFAVVRSISDRADDTAHVDFARFIEEVDKPHTRAMLLELLQRLQA
jgi:adenosylhomocysteine nucleosidase